MSDLAAMLQVSLIGYAASGAFLGLAYFDLYYHLIALIVILRVLLLKHTQNGLQTSTDSSLDTRDFSGRGVKHQGREVP